MDVSPEEVKQKSLKIRVRHIRIIIFIIDISIVTASIIGYMTNIWNPSSGTILFLLMFMMIPLVFLINPENPHEE